MARENVFKVAPYRDQYRDQVVKVWERSVLATHYFLKPVDFAEIKSAVEGLDFTIFQVNCAMLGEKVVGFIGIAARKIEMLFVDPDFFGQGVGTLLMNYALSVYSANAVDVNEQNEQAFLFYRKFGFETIERTDLDDQGKDYPLLRMRLRIA